MNKHVRGVITADTKRDISDLINAAVDEYGFDGVGFLAGLIGESDLHEHAVRERVWKDVSYGLSQPTVAYLHPDSGVPLLRGADGVALDTPQNRQMVKAWAHDAANIIEYTARRYAELIERFKTDGDPLKTWTRWNAPGRSLEENAVAQPHAIRNYRNGLAAAETYRVKEATDMAKPQPPAGIIWKPSPNFEAGRGGVKPVAIVNHVAEGSLAGVDSWFGQTASQVSAHFCVGKAGEIHQYVRSSDTAWANGRLNQPNTAIPWIADAVNRGINPNRLTISIEREGFTGEPLTEPMYQSILVLHRYLCGYWNIPADAHHIVGHRDLDSVTRANCPGLHFPWDRLLDELNFTAPEPSIITMAAALDEIFRVAGLIAGKHPDVLPEVTTIHLMVDVLKGG